MKLKQQILSYSGVNICESIFIVNYIEYFFANQETELDFKFDEISQ
tara:strand:- start:250 stop:387 length:138 start_codon:yes stop_codon:yes gene_type:complete